jgi:flagella basal body P-ring formation protein FlgA
MMGRLPAPRALRRPALAACSILGVLGFLGTGAASPATGSTPRREPLAVITFGAAAEVRRRVIRLGDVAAVESPDRKLVARLVEIEVGSAPLAGRSRTLSTQYVRVCIRQLGVDPDRLRIDGPAAIIVSRPDQTVPGKAIAAAACEAIQAGQAGTRAEPAFAPADQRVPVGTVELKPATSGSATLPPSPTGGTVSVPVRVLVDGHEEAVVTVPVRLQRLAPALVAARDLPAGTVLAEGDVQVEERPVLPGPLVLSDPAQAAGQQLSLPIRGGTALTASMLRPPVLIKRGARVRLICRGPSFVASVSGEALQDGVAGQTIRVRNLTSLLEVTGIPVDSQTVEVPF